MSSCRRMKSIRDGSWFSGSHLSLEKILEITYLWCEDLPQHTIMKWCQVAEHTIVDWCCFCREVCIVFEADHFEKIGGPGCIVEIDESKFGKRKYNRGRLRDGKWVLGGIERGSDNIFVRVVHTRDAATLLPIIQKCVEPGTTIITDEWHAYGRLSAHGFTHQSVNHTLHFVDPTTGAHTNNIEGTWSLAKMKLKRGSGTSSQHFPGYLVEYMWRRKYGKDFAFANFINHIANVYKVF